MWRLRNIFFAPENLPLLIPRTYTNYATFLAATHRQISAGRLSDIIAAQLLRVKQLLLFSEQWGEIDSRRNSLPSGN
jgi:hypothetical protein